MCLQRRAVKAAAVSTAPLPQVQKLEAPKALGYCMPGKFRSHGSEEALLLGQTETLRFQLKVELWKALPAPLEEE